MIAERFDQATNMVWRAFADKEKLTENQEAQFLRYIDLLQCWNEKINLTRIIQTSAIITNHFQDSLAINQFVDIASRKGICDVGSGAGFPGIPLKIMYPGVPVVLVEVVAKKAAFLRTVIAELGLDGIDVCTLDWRTVVHTAPYKNIDLCVARASLRPDELVRVLSKESVYKRATVVYWASMNWEMGEVEAPFFVREESYMIGDVHRKLIFFART